MNLNKYHTICHSPQNNCLHLLLVESYRYTDHHLIQSSVYLLWEHVMYRISMLGSVVWLPCFDVTHSTQSFVKSRMHLSVAPLVLCAAHHIQHNLAIHNSGAEKCNSSPVWPFHLSLNLSLEQENHSAILSTWSCDDIVIYPSSLSIPGFRELVLVLWSLCSRENSPQQFCKTRS